MPPRTCARPATARVSAAPLAAGAASAIAFAPCGSSLPSRKPQWRSNLHQVVQTQRKRILTLAPATVACCNAVGCGRAVSNRPGAHGAGLATTASLSILIRILVAQGCCSRGAGTCTACRSLGAVAGSQSAFPPITIAAARAKRSAPRPDTPAYVMLCVLAARWRTRAQGAFHVRAAGRARRRAHGKDP